MKKTRCFIVSTLAVLIWFTLAACGDSGDPSSPPDNRPNLTGTVTINNTLPQVGNTLTASYLDGNGTGTATWQWIRGESTNIGTNSNTYNVTAADEGKTIKVQVSFANQKGNRTSIATGVVTAADNRPDLTGTVTIDNTSPQVGNTLTASYSDGNGTGMATWQWIRGESTNIGTDSGEYIVVEADWGQPIKVQVSFAGQKGSGTSVATAAVIGGQLTLTKWRQILQTIRNDTSFDGTLDLSCYTRSVYSSDTLSSLGSFDPEIWNESISNDKIKNIILPDAAISIANSFFWGGFNALETVTGANITAITTYAFQPAINTLKSVDFPKATSIGRNAFADCTGLEMVHFAEAVTIDTIAFKGCTKLATVVLPEATTIGDNAFEGCTSLTNISFPKATALGIFAFWNCTALIQATFPMVATVGSGAFEGCTFLTRVDLPSVTRIGAEVFADAGAQFQTTSLSSSPALRVILGKEPPNLGVALFVHLHTGALHVRVEIPLDANKSSYDPTDVGVFSGTDNTDVWGNGFRGAGWNGSSIIESSYRNTAVVLRIAYWDDDVNY
jgi:DUF971 family protein